jgi:hypothetical protein
VAWSEAPGGGGCPNFCTGAGGYLQSIWAGFGGITSDDDALLICAPALPMGSRCNSTAVLFRRVAYAGGMLDIRVDAEGETVVLSKGSGFTRCCHRASSDTTRFYSTQGLPCAGPHSRPAASAAAKGHPLPRLRPGEPCCRGCSSTKGSRSTARLLYPTKQSTLQQAACSPTRPLNRSFPDLQFFS